MERGRLRKIVRPLRGGQITIPAEFRRRLGITEDSVLQLILEDDELRLKPVDLSGTAEGSAWFKDLYHLFAPVREEASSASEAEIDDAINEAVSVSRGKRKAPR